MTPVERIQSEIEALSPEDFARLRNWFVEKDWQTWDRQLEADVAKRCRSREVRSPHCRSTG